MVGAKGTLVIKRPHSWIIGELIGKLHLEYKKFLGTKEAHSRGNYPTFLSNIETEFKLLEEAGEEIRSLEAKLIGRLKDVETQLSRHKKQLRKHEHAKALINHIDQFLRVINHIEKAIRRGGHLAMDQEGVVIALTKK